MIFNIAGRQFHAFFAQTALKIRSATGPQPDTAITAGDLLNIPEPAARYLRYSGVIGKKRMSYVRILHSGQFKTGANRPFVPLQGEYYITTKKPSFCWYGKLNMFPGVSAAAFDSYYSGKGRMFVKLMSLFTIVDAQSAETDNSAFGRCFAEMTMVPTFFLDKELLRWRQTGKNSVKCALTDSGMSAEAELFVNADGSLDRIEVMRYYDAGGGKTSLEKFTGKPSEYKETGGFMLASRLDGYWNLKSGDLHYVTITIDKYEIE